MDNFGCTTNEHVKTKRKHFYSIYYYQESPKRLQTNKHSEGVAFDERKQTWMQFNKWMSKSCTHLWCFPRLITPTHVLQHTNNSQKARVRQCVYATR